jgi:hypothetical protein
VLVLSLAWQAPAPVIAQEACGDFAVAVAPQTPGQPLSDNVVSLLTPEGELSSGDSIEPLTVTPSSKSGVALVRSLGGIYGLMDVATGGIRSVQIPENDQPRLSETFPTIRNAAAAEFMLLAELPHAVWLVDLATGDAVDLATLGEDGPRFIDSAAISPDGKWLIYSAQEEAFLISLETPGELAPLDSEPILPYPGFDEQSDVMYAVDGDLQVSIRSLDPETGTRADLFVTPSARVMPIQHSTQILLLDGDELLAFAEGAMPPTTLFEFEGDISRVLTDTTGAHMLIGDNVDDTVTWHWVDTTTGTQNELTELENMAPFATGMARDTVLFVPTVLIGPGVPGAPYRTLDLTTGAVATALEQDSDDVWQVLPGGDRAGRYMIVNAVSPGSGRLWLIDNRAGTATQIATSTGNARAAVSPDGCQLAVSIYDTIGEGRTSSVTVTSLVDGSTTMQIPDALLLGWADVPANNQREKALALEERG